MAREFQRGHKARISDLTAETPVADAARHALTVRLEVVRDYLPLALHEAEKDPEHVHQLRVGTRRARAALDIFSFCLPQKAYRTAKKALRGLRPEDCAALHPRGTLGWRALFRVGDLMHGGDTVPLVREEASIKDAVEEMTRKRPRTAAAGAALHSCGMTTVVDADGRLTGVITDGDLRRMQLAGGPTSDARAGEVATRGPKTIAAEELAAKALEVMEAWAITSLVVVDGATRPVGVIHMHDILRAKIV